MASGNEPIGNCSFRLIGGAPVDQPLHLKHLTEARNEYAAAKNERMARALREKARQFQTDYVETAPVHLRETISLVGPDVDFARLFAEYLDLYNPRSWGWAGAGSLTDHKYGANWPFYRTEQELTWMRSASRYVAGWNGGHASGFIGGVGAYVIGKGHTVKAVPLDKTNDPSDARLCAMVEAVIEEFTERTLFNELQQQIFAESLIDGEFFLWVFDCGDHVEVRKVWPELVKQPPGEGLDEWSFGIKCHPDDIETFLAYHVCTYGSAHGDIVPASDIVHFPFYRPGGWTRGIKRGMPIFTFGIKEAFDLAGKLLRNVGEGTAIREAFAYIVQHAPTSNRSSIADFEDSNADVQITRPYNTARTQNIQKALPGYTPHIGQGMEYKDPPTSAGAAAAIEVVDALLRNAGTVLNAPTWLVGTSGRDQAAYSSDLVHEAPFVKRGEQVQEYYGGRFKRVYDKVVKVAINCGRLPPHTLQRVRLTVEHPSMASRDENIEATTNAAYVNMGVKSRQQVAAEKNLDWDKQQSDNLAFAKAALEAEIELLPLKQKLANMQMQQSPDGEQPEAMPAMPGAETGGDEPGEDLNPFGDIAESLLIESVEAMLREDTKTPPRPGLVFDRTKHRWVRPNKDKKGTDSKAANVKPISREDLQKQVAKVHDAPDRITRRRETAKLRQMQAGYRAGLNTPKPTGKAVEKKPKNEKPSKSDSQKWDDAQSTSQNKIRQQSIVGNFVSLISSAWKLGDAILNKIGDKIDNMGDDAVAFAANSVRGAMEKAYNRAKSAKDSTVAAPGQFKDSLSNAMRKLATSMAKLQHKVESN